MGRPNATCLPKSRSWPHAIQPLVLNLIPVLLGNTIVVAIVMYIDAETSNPKCGKSGNDCITQWKKPPNKNRTPLLWASLTLDSSFCRMIGLQEWSYLVIFHHEPSLRGRKKRVTWDVSLIHHTSDPPDSHTRGKIKICPYSLPTTKDEPRTVENLYNEIKDSKSSAWIIPVQKCCK